MLPDYIQNACDWANMQGWKVFPANPNTKAPHISDPFGRATSNRDAIIELFSQFPVDINNGDPIAGSGRYSYCCARKL